MKFLKTGYFEPIFYVFFSKSVNIIDSLVNVKEIDND